ncbi:hypothetical protein MTR67_027920 [Solanum verrucosum]|uniref:Uncharacterized protein n=1 Tax=Solanum verrucosum TaxID=315347 RepID=A0AAF0R505_SOLVR|nr:hypothetical protein MTR67_027920 [Solanum verrucosum]
MPFFRGLFSMKKRFSSADSERRKKENDCYLQNGRCVLEELLALCDGNCRIPIRYFSAIEINNAIKHSKTTIMELDEMDMVMGSLDNRPVLVRFNTWKVKNMHRDIAITAQMSHLKNVLRLVGCCLEFEQPVMVYQYVEGELEVQEDKIYGTHGSMAPEHVIMGIITQKVDVYSFRVLLFQLLTGKRVPDIYMDRVDSTTSEDTMDFEEDITVNFKFIDGYIKEGINIMDLADPIILEEHGIEIQQQLKDFSDLAKKCTAGNGDDRPYMIHVARELCRIEKCLKY